MVLPCGLVHLQLARRPGLGAKAEGLSQAGGVQREVLQMFCGLHKRKRWSLAWRAGDRNNTLKQGLIFEAPALQLALAMGGGAFHHAIFVRDSSDIIHPTHSGPKALWAQTVFGTSTENRGKRPWGFFSRPVLAHSTGGGGNPNTATCPRRSFLGKKHRCAVWGNNAVHFLRQWLKKWLILENRE